MNARNIYDVARELGRRLSQEGVSAWEERINDAIDFGSTGTEILMALRWNLLQLRQAAPPLSEATSRLLDELVDEVSDALR